ncbi:MAG: lipopolysaccharide assembly protein LapA domain-containing protein [Solirubrobacterales bacterium]
MARLLGWIVGLPLALLAVMFAVANRHEVRLDLWPLPWSLEVPVYLATLGSLVGGILVGALIAWASSLPARRRASVQRRRADSLQRQLDAEHARAALPGPADHGA